MRIRICFIRDAIQQIALYSNGIPRLMNIICDNALLCAYARSKKIVSADMIKEVARDLRLGSEVQVTEAETPPVPVSETERKDPFVTQQTRFLAQREAHSQSWS